MSTPPVGPVGGASEPHQQPPGGQGWYEAMAKQSELLTKSLQGEVPEDLPERCRDQNAKVGNAFMQEGHSLPPHVGEAATLIIHINEAAINKQGIASLPHRSKDPSIHLDNLQWELRGVPNPPPQSLVDELTSAIANFDPKDIARISSEIMTHLLKEN